MHMPPIISYWNRSLSAAALLFLVLAAPVPTLAQNRPGPLAAAMASSQPQPAAPVLTLAEAIQLAEARSEQIAIAHFGIPRAPAVQQRARSERQPQLSASASYDRTLKSEFSGLF